MTKPTTGNKPNAKAVMAGPGHNPAIDYTAARAVLALRLDR